MLFSLILVPPICISLWNVEHAEQAFGLALILILMLGLLLWLPVYRTRSELRVREGFLVVSLFWIVLALAGALPFTLTERPHVSFTDAVFESMSGLTTTGATVITGLDFLPKSVLFYRMELHWLGGMGIVVLAVAVLPMLGGGGMQLFRAETPGPIKDSKLTPRIKETAKALWLVYIGLTAACALSFWLAGMNVFDAITHAFSTISTGGFGNYDDNFGYFKSSTIEVIAILFMMLGGINAALHYAVWVKRNPIYYFMDTECVAFIGIIAAISLVVALVLWNKGHHESFGQTLLLATFHTVSLITTTGYTTEDYSLWPGFAAMLLLLSTFIGGSAGSTSGGIKVVRLVLLIKQGVREILRLLHPNAQIPIRIGGKPVSVRVIEGIWGFFAVYTACFLVLYLGVALTDVDLMAAFSGVAACMNNAGPGLSVVSLNYAGVPDAAKWILVVAMLLGRLEVFTLLVLFTASYWRW